MNESPSLNISNYQHLEEIFQIAVETTKKSLKCDRVVIYGASEISQPEAIVEAVESQYISVLGKKITDPFLAKEYLEMYCYGRVVAINDISTINIEETKLADFKKLEIKSLLIAPISFNGELLAFLIVHQCSATRNWSSETIKFLEEKVNTVSYALANIIKAQKPTENTSLSSNQNPLSASALEKSITKQAITNQINENSLTMDRGTNGNAKDNIEYSPQTKIQENKVTSLADVIREITNESEQQNIFDTAVKELRHLLNCDRVLIYSLDRDRYGTIIAESVAAGFIKGLGKTVDDPCFAARYIEKYRQGRVRAWDSIYAKDATPCYIEQLEALGVKAKVVAPIIHENELLGLLIAHQCNHTRHWQEQEINWITEIATQIGIMLEYTEMFAETDSETQKLLAESDNKWNQHFTEAIQYIRASIDKEDILKASVKEARRVLNCDRVVVYSQELLIIMARLSPNQ